MPEDIDLPRRRLFGTALMTLAAAPFVSIGPAAAQTMAAAPSQVQRQLRPAEADRRRRC